MRAEYPSFIFYLTLFLWWFGILAGSAGLGRLLLRGLRLQCAFASADWLLGTGLGLALLSYMVFLGSALHMVSPLFLVGLFCLWVLAGYLNFRIPAVREHVLDSLSIHSPLRTLLLIYLAVLAACNLIPVLVPAVDWDGLAYHLALPKIYLAAGGFVFRPDIFHNLFPQFTEMLYLLGAVFPFGLAAKLVHYTFGLLAAWAVYAAGRETGLRVGAWLAGAIFYAQYLVHVESGTAFVDLAPAAYLGMAFVAFLHAGRAQAGSRWLNLGLFLTGVVAAAKWHGLILLALAAGWAWIRIGQGTGSVKGKLRAAGAALGWGVLPVLPYMARAWIMGGNPCWPLGYGIFGGKNWNAEIAQRVTALHQAFAGAHAGWQGFLSLPLDLIAHGDKFGLGGPQLRWPLLAFALTAGLWAWQARTGAFRNWMENKRKAEIIYLVLAGVLYLYIWHATSPQIRFLLPAFPLAAWLAARALSGMWMGAGKIKRWSLVLTGGMFFLVHPPVHHNTAYQVQTLLGRAAAGDFISREQPHYSACRYLDREVGPGEKVLLFGENRGFYLNADYLWGDPMMQALIDFRNLRAPRQLLKRLRELGVCWVLFRTDVYPPEYLDPASVESMREVLRLAGDRVFSSGPVSVYRLR